MNAYRLTLKLLSGWASPWHADTLFGSLCWMCRFIYGNEKLQEDWLVRFRNRNPVFVLSDAFPAGLLPLPIGWAYPPAGQKVKSPFLIAENDFVRMLRDNAFREAVITSEDDLYRQPARLQAAIDRDYDRSEFGGALFQTSETHFDGSVADKSLWIYFRTDEVDAVVRCFEMLGARGHGKKSSTGLGAFEVADPPHRVAWLEELPEQANAFVALSHFVPHETDPVDGNWAIRVKYPKFHGSLVEHPFKGRLLTLTPGSNFRVNGPPKEWYGQTLNMKASEFENGAVHCGLALAAPARL